MSQERVEPSAKLVEAFGGMFLSPALDQVKPTPEFHREAWAMYVKDDPFVSIAAPRGHAKSSALTYIFGLACLCFRWSSYAIVVSATEKLALAHVGDMIYTLRTNQQLRTAFGIKGFEEDTKGRVIVVTHDNWRFCIEAIGFGQKIRGLKWNNQRPNLILCDDLEDDDQVESPTQLEKSFQWFYRKLLPLRSVGARVRLHGTILGSGTILAKAMESTIWKSKLYKAHQSFSDFSNILWPEMYPEAALREIRQLSIDNGDTLGYSQEYLNTPIDETTSFIRQSDMLPMTEEDHETQKIYYIGCDFAVMTTAKHDRTSFTVGGRDEQNLLHIVDQYCGRWDALEWCDLLFEANKKWHPEMFFVEGGLIWRTIEPVIQAEMRRRSMFLPIYVINSTKSKGTRGTAFQKRSRAKGMRFDHEAEWYPDYMQEIISFTPGVATLIDDQFDSTSILTAGLEKLSDLETEDIEEAQRQDDVEDDWYRTSVFNKQRSAIPQRQSLTGY